MSREYHVIRGADDSATNDDSFNNFVANVDDALADGWRLEGGICAFPVSTQGTFKYVLLCQAVSREIYDGKGR